MNLTVSVRAELVEARRIEPEGFDTLSPNGVQQILTVCALVRTITRMRASWLRIACGFDCRDRYADKVTSADMCTQQ